MKKQRMAGINRVDISLPKIRLHTDMRILAIVLLIAACAATPPAGSDRPLTYETLRDTLMLEPIIKSEAEWKAILTAEQYKILRQKGTEWPWRNEYNKTTTPGIYVCAGCGTPLFDSETKYDSGSGWPSFWAPIQAAHVAEKPDNSLWMTRTEVVCARCGGHLGHVFDDGPKPTGLRYCMNSAAMRLVPKFGD
jgi:peptide-methionine (R)-S-oxide reductase